MPEVLHLVNSTWPDGAGYTVRTEGVTQAQRAAGLDVAVATWCGAPGGPGEVWRGAVVHLHPVHGPLTRALERWRVRGVDPTERLRWLWNRRFHRARIERRVGSPELVHAHTPPRVGREAEAHAAAWRVPWVYEVRGLWDLTVAAERGVPGDARRAVGADAAVARRADHVVAISQALADLLVRAGVPAGRITLVPNGVDLDRGAAAAVDLPDWAVGRRLVGVATSVRRLEGLGVLLEAWPQVVRAVPEAVFVLLGDGPDLPELRRRAAELGVEASFRCLGRVPFEQVPGWLGRLEVAVYPRLAEPVGEVVTPLKPLEALAAGVPVLGSDVGGLRELVTSGSTGLLVPAGRPEALADGLVTLLRDDAGRAALGQAGQAWVRRERAWEVLVRRLEPVYERLRRAGA